MRISTNEYQHLSDINEDEINSLNGVCNTCKMVTQLRCNRCGDYYCSTKCQRIDWPVHRYICFQIPDLVSAEYYLGSMGTKNSNQIHNEMAQLHTFSPKESQEKDESGSVSSKSDDLGYMTNKKVRQLEYELPPSNNSIVIVSAVVKPNSFYIRSVEGNKTYLNNVKTVSILGETAKPLKKPPNMGDVVITTFEGEGIFYRALVLQNVDKNKILVSFVDFGNTDVKQLSDLREMPEELYSLKVYPVRINLKNIEKDVDNADVNKYLESFETEGTPLKIINITTDRENIIECEFIHTLTNENVNQRILEISSRSIPQINKDDKNIKNNILHTVPVMTPPFNKEVLPISEEVEVYILDNSLLNIGIFSCCLIGKQNFMDKGLKALKKIADSDTTPYKPKPGEYCIAIHKEANEWYRAQAIQYISETEVLLVFVDYGDEASVDINCIRRYPDQDDANFPCYANTCIIEDLPNIPPKSIEYNKELTRRLKELIDLYSHQILKVNYVKDDVVSVNMNFLTRDLQTQGLI